MNGLLWGNDTDHSSQATPTHAGLVGLLQQIVCNCTINIVSTVAVVNYGSLMKLFTYHTASGEHYDKIQYDSNLHIKLTETANIV